MRWGFDSPTGGKIENSIENDSKDTRYKDFMEQDDLNVEVTAVYDIFDKHAEETIAARLKYSS